MKNIRYPRISHVLVFFYLTNAGKKVTFDIAWHRGDGHIINGLRNAGKNCIIRYRLPRGDACTVYTVIHKNVKQENDRLRLHNTIPSRQIITGFKGCRHTTYVNNADDAKTVCQFRNDRSPILTLSQFATTHSYNTRKFSTSYNNTL